MLRGARRFLSAGPSESPLRASSLVTRRVSKPGGHPAMKGVAFGRVFSDHMLQVDWEQGKGWGAPEIGPFGPLSIHPAASSLHYGLQDFEGMKAYRDAKDHVRLFRPDMNMARMRNSNKRLALPDFDGAELLECIKQLLRLDRLWIPQQDGYSLYLRPTCISTQPTLGVAPPAHAKIFVITCPVGPYYESGFAPIKLMADPTYVRAWPGGTGNSKVGGNYAPGIMPQRAAAAKGYAQILWLFGPDHQVTEVGAMNQFFFWKRRDGTPELVTAELDGTILPGVTRDSILALARSWGEFSVSERRFTMREVVEAVDEGRMLEAFGAGTAAVVAPVNGISYLGKEYAIPLDTKDPNAKIGPLAHRFAKTIMDIQYGRTPHEWSVVVD